jgi:uncharacterized membrane protein HdeD (DUF308 family)
LVELFGQAVEGGAMLITSPLNRPSWVRQTIQTASRGWWLLLLSGLVSIVAGGIILLGEWTIGDLAAFIGAVFIVRGIVTAASIPLDGSARRWSIVFGLLQFGVGMAVWTWPGQTLLVLAAFIGWWVLFSGVMNISGSVMARGILPYWGVGLVLGIAELLLSFYLLGRPGLTLFAAIVAVGIWSIVYGVVELTIALDLRAVMGRLDSTDVGAGNGSRSDSSRTSISV